MIVYRDVADASPDSFRGKRVDETITREFGRFVNEDRIEVASVFGFVTHAERSDSLDIS